MRNIQHALLDNAKINKNDEFYTQLSDINRELQYYEKLFKDKVVFCNCDDPRYSNFYRYFVDNFERLSIKKIICACFQKGINSCGYYYEYTGKEKISPELDDLCKFHGNGDFRNPESIALLQQSDIVVSNPPFSLFREYVSNIIQYNKKFLIIGNINAITYKEIFKLIKNNQAWLGVNLGRGISGFIVPEEYELYGTETKIDEFGNRIISPNNCLWLTNLDNTFRHEKIVLEKKYSGHESEYPFYDNYHGINVDKTKDIPIDYDGAIGVPITFLHKFNPNQFEILKFRKGDDNKDLSINGKCPYFRILIKHKVFPPKEHEVHIADLPLLSLLSS